VSKIISKYQKEWTFFLIGCGIEFVNYVFKYYIVEFYVAGVNDNLILT